MNIFIPVLLTLFTLSLAGPVKAIAADLTANTSYTIEVDAINSSGQLVDLGLQTIATSTTENPPKLNFSFNGIPTTSSYNFIVVTIKDNAGTVIRRSIVPAPAPNGSVNLGVSPLTKAQADALILAMQSAGSDDPMIVLFGSIVIRSGGLGDSDIKNLGEIAKRSIRGPNGNDTTGGFNYYMLNNSAVGAIRLASFKSSIVAKMREYSGLMKDSVDAATEAASKNERAEACALLSRILIEAANDSGFDVSYIYAAMKSASDQQEKYLVDTATQNSVAGAAITEAAVSAMDSVMGSNYKKIAAESLKKKYLNALTTLGASESQTTRATTALTTLSNSLISAFQTMEEAFQDEDANLDDAVITAKYNASQDAMRAAFDQLFVDLGSTKAEIDTMVTAMQNGFCEAGAGGDSCRTTIETMRGAATDGVYKDGYFAFRYTDRNSVTQYINWPLTLVVPVTWVATSHPSDFTYTRDTLTIPAASWIDSNTGVAGKTRHDYGDFDTIGVQDDDADEGNGLANDELCLPAALANVLGLREDVEIINHLRWVSLAAASRDMLQSAYDNELSADDQAEADVDIGAGNLSLIAAEDTAANEETEGILLPNFNLTENLAPYLTGAEVEAIQSLYLSHLSDRKDAIGPAALTDEQKQALIDLCIPPDFN